jgi:hypothetical protein
MLHIIKIGRKNILDPHPDIITLLTPQTFSGFSHSTCSMPGVHGVSLRVYLAFTIDFHQEASFSIRTRNLSLEREIATLHLSSGSNTAVFPFCVA